MRSDISSEGQEGKRTNKCQTLASGRGRFLYCPSLKLLSIMAKQALLQFTQDLGEACETRRCTFDARVTGIAADMGDWNSGLSGLKA